jgi:MFS family permease
VSAADRVSPATTARSLAGLDWVNFFLADVASGFGPFLAIYLLAKQHWNAASIGVVLTIGGVAGLVAQTPAGALIDATQHKRAWLIGTTALISVSVFLVTLIPTFAVITVAQLMLGTAAAIFPSTLAAIALGIVGPKNYTYRIGRMQAFNHAGNVIAALAINPRSIDNRLARGLAPQQEASERPSGLATLLGCRPLLTFAITIMLFHLANAAMLPIMGQKLAIKNTGQGTLFLAAFVALPLRGVLFTLSNNALYLVSIQILDGVGAGIFGALFPLVIADLTRGTGRYNLAFGVTSTMQGIGVALSTTVAGVIIVTGGYNLAFLALAGIAFLALVIFFFAVPETGIVDSVT